MNIVSTPKNVFNNWGINKMVTPTFVAMMIPRGFNGIRSNKKPTINNIDRVPGMAVEKNGMSTRTKAEAITSSQGLNSQIRIKFCFGQSFACCHDRLSTVLMLLSSPSPNTMTF